MPVPAAIKAYKVVFWDFDGVIKDSVDTKTEAFVKLFEPYGPGIAQRVRAHHQANGGMSRLEKIPLYLEWAGRVATADRVDTYCERFRRLAMQRVIDSPWVPGVETYLRANPYGQTFVLVSATPQDEIEQILRALDLHSCFAAVFGAPTRKKDAIGAVLDSHELLPEDCLMVGDARADCDAAQTWRVPFLLRRHSSNAAVFANYTGPTIEDFMEA